MPLSNDQIEDLSAFAGTIIPASAAYGVPGADDDTIFADIMQSLGRDLDDVTTALARLKVLAGGTFAALTPQRRLDIANLFRAEGGPALAAISRVVLLSYYRDDRVMQSLGQEPRPPFPKGHIVEQGDWSLLEPVKQRKPFYRSQR